MEHSQARSLLDGLSVITEGTSGAGAARNGNGCELRMTPPDEDEVPVQNLVPPRTSKRLRSADPHNKPRNEEDGPDGPKRVLERTLVLSSEGHWRRIAAPPAAASPSTGRSPGPLSHTI